MSCGRSGLPRVRFACEIGEAIIIIISLRKPFVTGDMVDEYKLRCGGEYFRDQVGMNWKFIKELLLLF